VAGCVLICTQFVILCVFTFVIMCGGFLHSDRQHLSAVFLSVLLFTRATWCSWCWLVGHANVLWWNS